MPKIRGFRKILKKKKVDFFLSVNLEYGNFISDMLYFSGYNGMGALIIPKDKKPFLIVPKGEAKSAKKYGLRVFTSDKKRRFFENIKGIIKRNKIKCKRIGINKDEFTLSLKDALRRGIGRCKLVDLQKKLYKLREQKTKEEIKIIKKACRISDNILEKCFREFKKFKTESDVEAFLEYEAKKMGCEIAFPTIVASGINSSEVHHKTENTKLKKGFCIIDFGIRYRNYCTDTTRAIYIGKPSKKEIEIYNFVLKIQKEAIKKVKLNKKCSEVFKEVKNKLGKYSKFFTHGLGHGLGIMVHELPSFFEDSNDIIKENSIFTIEPGIYLRNFGIRIEDCILATKNKIGAITKAQKEMLIIRGKNEEV